MLFDGLNVFRAAKQLFVVVINEYGIVVGLVIVKDLFSSFMG